MKGAEGTPTPGPWRLEKCRCGAATCGTWGVSSGMFYQGCGFTLADARIVVEAPLMLEALRMFVEQLPAPRSRKATEVWDGVRAIIARIESKDAPTT